MNSLKNLLEELEGLHPKYIDLSLTRIEKLLKKLNNPHLKLPKCIHIAGTNGKGSTLSFIKNILIESNLKVHAYTSPHLEKINERFIIANKIISNKKLFEYLKYIKKINANKPITFYEITTAAAFYMFSKNYADVLILETGLGGRLDATNIIKNNLISIITKIGYDHQEYLGKSIKKITKEKLGIIKKGSIIINAKQSQIVNQEIKKYTQINKNKILSYESDWKIINASKDYFYIKKNNNIKTMYPKPNLNGEHQLYNLSTAIITSEYLKKLGYRIHKKNIDRAILKTKWPGRLEILNKDNPLIIIDGSHNIDGAKTLKSFIKNKNYKPWIILGMMNSKNLNQYLKILKSNIKGVIAVEIPNEKNSIAKEEIKKNCKKIKIKCKTEKDIYDAVTNYINNKKNDQIIITGSLYLVGKTRKKIIKLLNQSIH